MKALLIVDVQHDFLPNGALPVPQGHEVIPVINALIPFFSCVVATKDWHPPHHYSFASTHNKKPGDVLVTQEMKQELWPDHCIQGSWGAEFAETLHAEQVEKVFFKGVDLRIDSYSAFFDNAHKRSTGLGEYLQARGVDEIYIAGLATDYCVKYSVLDAARFNLKTFVVIDACRGINLKPGDVERAVEEMRFSGAQIITSLELTSQS